MIATDDTRLPLGIVGGTLCIAVALTQFLYSFLAFASVFIVDLLGIGLTLASAAIAAVPDKPFEIPYERALAKTIAATGMLFSGVAFVSGGRCFYLRHVARIDFAVCAAMCMFLAALHFMKGLSYAGALYVAASGLFSGIWLGDWAIVRAANKKRL